MKYDDLCGEIVTEILQQAALFKSHIIGIQLVCDCRLWKICLKPTFLIRSAKGFTANLSWLEIMTKGIDASLGHPSQIRPHDRVDRARWQNLPSP